MQWVRVHSHFDLWAEIGPPPSFSITSDDDGEAFIEIAKTRELLIHPYSDPGDPWNVFFSAEGSNDRSVGPVPIQISGGKAVYTLPDAVWRHMREVMNVPSSDQCLYYRVKARPAGAGSGGWASHTDTDVQSRRSPYIQVVPLSGDIYSDTPINDAEAIGHLNIFFKIMLALIQLPSGNSAERQALARLLNHPTYAEQRSSAIRAKVLELFIQCGGSGRQVFERLLDLQVPVGTRQDGSYMTTPALYYRDERNEGTTLEHLLALWNIQLDPRIPISLSDVIFEAIVELIDPPGQINQGMAGTCAATSIQCYTAWRNPAEYARWCRYLMDRGQNHRVQLAKNGTYIRANPEAFDVETWENVWKRLHPGTPAPASWEGLYGRTYIERGIQAAIMDYANFRYTYNPEQDTFDFWIFTVEESGLWEFEISRTIESIFDQPWKFAFGGGDVNNDTNPTAANNLFSYFEGFGLPVIITMKWDKGAHAVLGLRIENNRMIFRNTQYRGSYPPPNYIIGNPKRKVHNLGRAEESMDLTELRAAIRGYCMESSSESDRGYTIAEIPNSLRRTVSPTA
jgi:hypothetical protein